MAEIAELHRHAENHDPEIKNLITNLLLECIPFINM